MSQKINVRVVTRCYSEQLKRYLEPGEEQVLTFAEEDLVIFDLGYLEAIPMKEDVHGTDAECDELRGCDDGDLDGQHHLD